MARIPDPSDTTTRPGAPHDERRAGVSAHGFGGTDYHTVVSSYPGAPGSDQWPAELFLFRAESRDGAVGAMAALVERLESLVPTEGPHLRDLAAAQHEVGTGPVQVAIVADDVDDLRFKLASGADATTDGLHLADNVLAGDEASGGAVAFLHPGQGSQRPGMLRDLFVMFPWLQRHLRVGDEYVEAMFPPGAHTREERAAQKAAITDTRVAQPTLGLAGQAVYDLLGQVGVRPAMSAGHSYGELVALATAGAIDEADLVALSRRRAEAILSAAGDDPGAMAAVKGTANDVRSVLGEGAEVVVANDNAPDQVVVSGPTGALDGAVSRLSEAGLTTKRLPVACAFHSPVVAAATDTLAAVLADLDVRSPTIPVWSNTTAAPYPNDPDEIRRLLAGQVGAPVRFTEQIEAMYEAGARIFVESGPGRVLTRLVGQILGDRPHAAIAVDASGDNGVRWFLLALAELAVHGVPVDPGPLYEGRDTDPDRALGAGQPSG
jgi:acyl transferase domain-containing protein